MTPATDTERDFRGAGCDERCRLVRAVIPGVFGRQELLIHAPEPHEEYGQMMAARVAERTGVVRTGRLAVDLNGGRVSVDGRLVHVTPRELRVLSLLARHIGVLILHDDLARLVFGLVGEDAAYRRNCVSVVNRLRARLRPDGWLISTIWNVGLRLEEIPVGEPAPDDPSVHQPRLLGWSRKYERCRSCERTDRPHNGRGYCVICHKSLGPKGRARFEEASS